jgi:hypothetical protein
LPIELGIFIAVNLILNGKTEFMITPDFGSVIWVFEKDTLSITLVITGGALFIVTVAISL